jgi:signal transduction histidine kinase
MTVPVDQQPATPSEARTVLEEFAAVIAHELNTPLGIVRMASESLLHAQATGGSEEQQHKLLEMIRRNSDLAIMLVRRLSLARDIEAGTVGLDLERLDLGALVEETVDDLRYAFLQGHTVDVDVRRSQSIRADATAAREIVFNLVSNAAKYSARDAPIEVTVDERDADMVVVVRNHGSGVTPGQGERIFGKFTQGDGEAPGSGLGLFISRGLARAHGGDLVTQPAADTGSEFVLSLPLS